MNGRDLHKSQRHASLLVKSAENSSAANASAYSLTIQRSRRSRPRLTSLRILLVVLAGVVVVRHHEASATDEFTNATQELNERLHEAKQKQRRFKRLHGLSNQKIQLLLELQRLQMSISKAEKAIEGVDNSDQRYEGLETTLRESEVRWEITNVRLEILERRTALEELTFEFEPDQPAFATESAALSKLLDDEEQLVGKFKQAWLNEERTSATDLERKFEELESEFELRREVLQLRFDLLHAREEGDEEWIRELQMELKQLGVEADDAESPSNKSAEEFPGAIQLTDSEIKAAVALDFDDEIFPRLEAACFDCHNHDEANGDLDLEQLVADKPFAIHRSQWQNVIAQLRVRSMPPPSAQQPSDADRRALIGWLTQTLDNFDYTTVRRVGSLPAKRLTHDEYNNTVRDLIGVDLQPASRFPTDMSASSGFENSANSLFIQPVTLERYVGAAEQIVQTAWPTKRTSVEHESAWRRLLGDVANLKEAEAIQRVIHRFATRAYRRPLEQEELDSLMRHYQRRIDQGDSSEVALREVLQVILISPNFLIRAESTPKEADRAVPLSDWELASRLSYFLWASMPDDELFQLARTGQLHMPQVLTGQVDRMLGDPRAKTLGSLFAAQWLGFAELDRVQRDQIENPWATDSLVESMKGESALLFYSLVQRNASIDQLLDADYTFINAELAQHYGIEGVSGDAMREVSLRDTPRRGVLGHGSILATTSLPRRTSPVMRGNWILTTLLGTPPPPPPPNVSEFNDRVANNERLSQRQKLELHRSNPNCYACHSQIDPLGFAMEEFEWFGRYRPRRNGKPVDSVGRLPSGTEVRGLGELSATLLRERRSDLARQLTRKMLAYALARQLQYYDEATVRDLTSQMEEGGRRLQTLIHAIVRSESFQKKQSPESTDR